MAAMVLRLDPRIPLVWRSPRDAQLGVDPVVAVLDELTLEEDRLLTSLRAGVSQAGFAMLAGSAGVSHASARRLLDRVAPALVTAPDPRPARPRLAVHGEGPIARGVADLLDQHADLGPLVDDDRTSERVDLAVLVAPWVISPADAGAWLRRDIPHLPVVASDGSIMIGPLVEPGVTACLHCVHAHRRDADPAWPAIGAQLIDRPAPEIDSVSIAQAVAETARWVRQRLREGGPTRDRSGDDRPGSGARDGESLRLDTTTGEISARRWSVHPECRCAARPGTDWAADADRASPAPSTRRPAASGLA